MPRANKRRPEPARSAVGGGGAATRTEEYAGRWWAVRQVRGRDVVGGYLCPGCQQQVAAALAHVVVWPADGVGGLDERRHWHARCWTARNARPPLGSWR